ncbi:flagellin [Gammaproteobacteria bacterium]|nr:flagellin [Gammaproteobacteria bacterium]
MTVINTNINANIARDAIGRNDRAMATSMERLSTGLRINSAKDDAAGLAIANRMAGQISGLNMANRNANDGMSMIQTVEGATKEVGNMLVRMRELSVQSASGTYSDSDRAALDLEFDQLRSEITRIQEKTTWNNQALMDGGKTVSIQLGASSGQTMDVAFADWSVENGKVYGTAAAKGTESSVVTFSDLAKDAVLKVGDLEFTAAKALTGTEVAAAFANIKVTGVPDPAALSQLNTDVTAIVGAFTTGGTLNYKATAATPADNTITFTSLTADTNVGDLTLSDTGASQVITQGVATSETSINAISIHDAAGAAAAIVTLDKAITGVTAEQAKYGAYLSRLQYASDNISNVATNLDQSRSRIQDADYAVETTALARTQIISQASTAMLAQANQAKQTVLSLLR